jgi:hypothetical protein
MSLLFATAMQGVTPDARDLASRRILNILWQLGAEFELTDEDSGPAWGEVCGSIQEGPRAPLKRSKDRAGHCTIHSSAKVIAAPGPHIAGSHPIGGTSATLARLTQLLCRMRC